MACQGGPSCSWTCHGPDRPCSQCVLVPMPAECCSSSSGPDRSLALEARGTHSRVGYGKHPNAPTEPCKYHTLCSSSAGGPRGLPSPASKASIHVSLSDGVLVPLGLGPELLPWVGGFLCWHHFQPLLIISSEAINLLQVGVLLFVL